MRGREARRQGGRQAKFVGDVRIESGVNLTVQDLLRQDARIQDLYFNISEMKLSITSLCIIYDAPKYDIFGLKTAI